MPPAPVVVSTHIASVSAPAMLSVPPPPAKTSFSARSNSMKLVSSESRSPSEVPVTSIRLTVSSSVVSDSTSCEELLISWIFVVSEVLSSLTATSFTDPSVKVTFGAFAAGAAMAAAASVAGSAASSSRGSSFSRR